MKLSVIVASLLIAFAIPVSAQQVSWVRTYTGAGYDAASDIIATSDSGSIVVGFHLVPPDVATSDIKALVIKLSSSGDIEWQTLLGTDLNVTGQSIFEMSNGELVVIGTTRTSSGAPGDVVLFRFSSALPAFTERRTRTSENEQVRMAIRSRDGGFIVTGTSGDPKGAGRVETFILKLDSTGAYEWMKNYLPDHRSAATDIFEAVNGDIILVGETSASYQARSDVFVRRVSASGDSLSLWVTATPLTHESSPSIAPMRNGGFMLAHASLVGSLDSIVIYRLDAQGNRLWDTTHSMEGETGDFAIGTIRLRRRASRGFWILAAVGVRAPITYYTRLMTIDDDADFLRSTRDFRDEHTANAPTAMAERGDLMLIAGNAYLEPYQQMFVMSNDMTVVSVPRSRDDNVASNLAVIAHPTGALAIDYRCPCDGDARFELVDAIGRVAWRSSEDCTTGRSLRIPIDAADLARGTYFMRADIDGKSAIQGVFVR